MGNRAGYLRVTEQFASFRKTCMSKSNQIAATASGINWIYENKFSENLIDLVCIWQDCINYYDYFFLIMRKYFALAPKNKVIFVFRILN